jgi:hypothetical protein
MKIRFLAAPAALLLALAACGNDPAVTDSDRTDAPTTVPDTTEPGTTVSSPPTSAPGIPHPMGPDDVVISLGYEGGFVPPDFVFTDMPRLVVTGDGSVYTLGAQIEIFPQPLLPPILVGHIDEATLQGLLAEAMSHQLGQDITYESPTNIADAPNTVVKLSFLGDTFTHSAYALGITTPETDPARDALHQYVQYLEQFMAQDHGEQPFVATSYAIRANPVDPTQPTDVEPNEVDWPASIGVPLASASECAVVSADAVGTLFADSTQITRFIEGPQQFTLLVRPMIPGDPGC